MGVFEVDGCRFLATKVENIEIDPYPDSAGHYRDGFVELVDASRMQIEQWTTGWFTKQVHVSLSGELVIFVGDLDGELRFGASDIASVHREQDPSREARP